MLRILPHARPLCDLGFGAHLARPLFREKHREDMTEAEARALLEEGLRVCYYRDKNSINKFLVATVTAEGTKVSEPFALATEWSLKAYDNPARVAVGTW
jgi:20S proteasome subunit beta 7